MVLFSKILNIMEREIIVLTEIMGKLWYGIINYGMVNVCNNNHCIDV